MVDLPYRDTEEAFELTPSDPSPPQPGYDLPKPRANALSSIDWERTRDITLGIAVETTGRAIALLIWALAALLVISLFLGLAQILNWIGDAL